MNRQHIAFVVLVSINLAVHAEVFKCQSKSGKTVYQSVPCEGFAQKQRILNVEQMTPEQRESAKAKLRDWQNQQAAEESAKAAAEKERRLEREREEALNLQRRSVIAQEQQAREAAQRQNQYRPGFGYMPYYPYYQPWQDDYRYPHTPDHHDRHHDRIPPSSPQFNPPNNSPQFNPPNRSPEFNPPNRPQFNPR
jgi:hypothetical protein